MGSLRSAIHCTLRAVLIEARQHCGLTQRQLAARLKRPHSWVAKIESAERRVSVDEFYEVASALAIAPDLLFKRFVQRYKSRNPVL